jgi:hypothetical protein
MGYKMKNNILLPAVIAALMLTACGSSKDTAGVWVNKEKIKDKSFSKVFIVAVTADPSARVQIENDLAAAATARGYQAVKSYDVIKPSLDTPKAPSKDEVVSKVKESGADAVFIASLLNKDEAIHYTPSKTGYSVMPYYSMMGNYYGYYSQVYPTVYTPGYYSEEKSFFILSNFYDAASEEIMWSVQSEVFNPSSLQKFSKDYMAALVKQLEKAKLLKK